MPHKILLQILFVLIPFDNWAQQPNALLLSEAISIVQQNSLQAAINNNNYTISNQTFRLQKAQLFPQINLNANLPGYNSSITGVTQPDGTIQFTTVEQAYSNMGINLSQKIAATGGTFTVTSNINRFDRLSNNQTTNYNTQPFVVGLTQPLFKYNEVAFNQRQADNNKIIGLKTLIKQNEVLALKTTTLYHAALQLQLEEAELFKAIRLTDTLLQIAKIQLALGKIEEEEYLQIQLDLLNGTIHLKQTEINSILANSNLCNTLNFSNQSKIKLELTKPDSSIIVSIKQLSVETLFLNYKQNTPEYEQQRLVQFQNHATLKRAKLNRLPNINLVASYGSNQSNPALSNAYRNLLTQRNATIGLSIPLFNAGTNDATLKIAMNQQQNQQFQLQQLEQQVVNDLFKQLQTLNLAISQIYNTQIADSISERRYEISTNKYKAGKITYTDFLLAQKQQYQSKQAYVNSIAAYWQAYYQLRVTTLYDIEKQESLYQNK